MTVHILKLAVGAESVDHLAQWQKRRLEESGHIFHRTRHVPRRRTEILDNGSIYWVVQGYAQVRQRIVGIERVDDDDGLPCCHLILDPELVRTRPQRRRPHQGWRYLEPDAAPPDNDPLDPGGDEPPPEMAAELRALGLI